MIHGIKKGAEAPFLIFSAARSDNPWRRVGLECVVAAKLRHGNLYGLYVSKAKVVKRVRQAGGSLKVQCIDDDIDVWV